MDEKKILALIFIIAFALRLAAVINIPERCRIPASDAAGYNTLALGLMAGKGLVDPATGKPSSWRVPLYPAFLAFIYSVFGYSFFAVRVIQCVMGALLPIIIFYITVIIFNRKIAMFAAFILAFYQPHIFFNFYGGPVFLLSENLFVILLALSLLYLLKSSLNERGVKYAALSGILLGLAVLTRPLIALFPLFLFVLFLFKCKSIFGTVKKLLPLFIGFALVLLPWTVRNFLVCKAFIPISTAGGSALYGGNNPYVKGGGIGNLEILAGPEEIVRLNNMSEVQRDKEWRRFAWEFLLKNYKQIPGLCFKKILVLWDIFETNYLNNKRIYNIWYATILMFGAIGLIKTIKSGLKIQASLLVTLFLYFSFLAMIFAGDSRFRYPVEPYLIIFASAGFFAINNAIKNKFLSYITVSSIIIINFIAYRYSDVVLNWVRSILCSVNI